MTHNSGGVRGVTVRQDFECFDALPVTLRRALAGANNKYCSVQIFDLWTSGGMSVRELVAELKRFERTLAREHESERDS